VVEQQRWKMVRICVNIQAGLYTPHTTTVYPYRVDAVGLHDYVDKLIQANICIFSNLRPAYNVIDDLGEFQENSAVDHVITSLVQHVLVKGFCSPSVRLSWGRGQCGEV